MSVSSNDRPVINLAGKVPTVKPRPKKVQPVVREATPTVNVQEATPPIVGDEFEQSVNMDDENMDDEMDKNLGAPTGGKQNVLLHEGTLS
jgi:hypothetical protein